jgi:hypothetical protein
MDEDKQKSAGTPWENNIDVTAVPTQCRVLKEENGKAANHQQ